MIRLRIRVPEQADQEITIQGNEAVIGRVNADVTVPHKVVSSSHAKVLAGVVVADLGSLNGVWVNGNRLDQPVILEGSTFVLGGDPKASTHIDVLEASVSGPGASQELVHENGRLRDRVAELERQLASAGSPRDEALEQGPMGTMMATPPESEPRAADPVPAPAPSPVPPPVPATKPKAPDGLPSFDEFFSVYKAAAGAPAPQPGVPPSTPKAAPAPVRHGDRQAVLDMIDRLIREDVGGRTPLMEGPVEQFFTLESFRLLRQVEKVITRIARDFVQLYEMKTMLPGQGGNFRSLAANVLVAPNDRPAREQLVKYLDQLCRWLGVSLAANRHSALKFAAELRERLSPEGLTRKKPIPVLVKTLGLRNAELWRRAHERLSAMTSSVVEDRLEEYVREFAEEHIE